MKHVIRRYANRKMYDPQARRSITLSGIASLLRKGVQVQVIDHPTGLDITSLTLSKVLLEQERGKETSSWGSFLFQELIRQGGSALLELTERSLMASMEAISAAEGRLREIVGDLASSRRIDYREGQKRLEKGLRRLAESKISLQSQLEKVVRRVMSSVDITSGSNLAEPRRGLRSPNKEARAMTRLKGRGREQKPESNNGKEGKHVCA